MQDVCNRAGIRCVSRMKPILTKYSKQPPSLGTVPLIYLSGQFTYPGREKELLWLKRTGCKYRCFSFAYVYDSGFTFSEAMKEQYEITKELDHGVMMDSSAHSFHKLARKSAAGKFKQAKVGYIDKVEALKESVIKSYYDFSKQEAHLWDFQCNFDYVREAPVVYAMQKRLEKMRLHPIPSFHGDAGTYWFEKYVDEGYKMIGIGAAFAGRKDYQDEVFNLATKHNILLHGFARTTLPDILGYPWFSVDSTTWLLCGAYGKILFPVPEEDTFTQLHISNNKLNGKGSHFFMEPSVKKAVRDRVEKLGFDFELLQTNLYERTTFNAYIMSNLDKLGFKRIEHVTAGRLF
jgi:hypothetical protein